MKKGTYKNSILFFTIVFFSSIINLEANVAFQNGWDREPIDSKNKDVVALTKLLQGNECPSVAYFANNENSSAVVARGLHSNTNDPRLHYTVRLYNCASDQLKYDKYVLKCNNWKNTKHVLSDGTCP